MKSWYGLQNVFRDMLVADYTVNTTYDSVDLSTGGAIGAGDDFTIWYYT